MTMRAIISRIGASAGLLCAGVLLAKLPNGPWNAHVPKASSSAMAQTPMLMAPGCYHLWTSQYYCPDTTMSLSTGTMRLSMFVGATETSPGRVFRIPAQADAVFFTMDAVDKFVIPYYARTKGADSAAAIREYYRRKLAPR